MYCKEVARLIDQRNQDMINQSLKNANGEVSQMYYEGMRVAFNEALTIAKQFADIEKTYESDDTNDRTT